jgi:uncharacterized protein with GYD domain
MATFLMFGTYTAEALKHISGKRTSHAEQIIKRAGGRIKAMYTLLGEDDLLIIVELPGIEWAIQVSIAISKMSGIAFRTVPAVTVEKFDAIMTR